MAWTSSAGPEGTFALANGADERCSLSKTAIDVERPTGNSSRPLAFATIAHLCGLAVVAPFADSNPVLAIPVVIGLTVSYLTHSYTSGNSTEHAPRDSQTELSAQAPVAEFTNSEITGNFPIVDLPIHNASKFTALPIPQLKSTEVSNELRA